MIRALLLAFTFASLPWYDANTGDSPPPGCDQLIHERTAGVDPFSRQFGAVSGDTYFATLLTAAQHANSTACSIGFQLYKAGDPSGRTITAHIYAASGAAPGSILASSTTTINAGTLPVTGDTPTFTYFNFAPYTFLAATDYYVGVSISGAADPTNYAAIWQQESIGAQDFSTDTVPTWTGGVVDAYGTVSIYGAPLMVGSVFPELETAIARR